MARSTYVYVVSMPGAVAATFTVKHECIAYLKRTERSVLLSMIVTRYPDGGRGDISFGEFAIDFIGES